MHFLGFALGSNLSYRGIILKLSESDRLKIVETYDGYPLDEKSGFHIYIGRNIPRFNPDDTQLVISQEELDEFFHLQEVFEGLTRFQCIGIWKGEQELSEMVTIFNVTLRDIITVFLDYIDTFEQEADYIEILNSKQILLQKRGDTNA
jgi:hypothetical protein